LRFEDVGAIWLALAGLLFLLCAFRRALGFEVAIADAGDHVDVTVKGGETDAVYVVESSQDLTNWSWCNSLAAASNGFTTGFFKVDQAQFYRARRLP
jgi:uncharacterized membrane protein